MRIAQERKSEKREEKEEQKRRDFGSRGDNYNGPGYDYNNCANYDNHTDFYYNDCPVDYQ